MQNFQQLVLGLNSWTQWHRRDLKVASANCKARQSFSTADKTSLAQNCENQWMQYEHGSFSGTITWINIAIEMLHGKIRSNTVITAMSQVPYPYHVTIFFNIHLFGGPKHQEKRKSQAPSHSKSAFRSLEANSKLQPETETAAITTSLSSLICFGASWLWTS